MIFSKLFTVIPSMLSCILLITTEDIIKTIVISSIAGLCSYFIRMFLDFVIKKLRKKYKKQL
jgi:uncharacterized MnhB-related membrane protein